MESKTLVMRHINPAQLKVLGKLGEGGLADLFEALDGQGNQVLMRRFKPQHRFNLSLRRSFLDGIRVRRKLGAHRHIVQYLGEGGSFLQPYEVIEYIPGQDLKSLIFRKHNVVYEAPVAVLKQAAAGMIHAHFRGYLHLDIKPENYLVRFTDHQPEVKLTDFDLALPVDTRKAPDRFGGSLIYLSPEFLQRKEVSVATDFFAFGVLAYNLFTHQMPFVGSVLNLLEHGPYIIPYPDSRDSLAYPPVRQFIDRCLARHPQDRFADDLDLLKAIEVLEQGYRACVAQRLAEATVDKREVRPEGASSSGSIRVRGAPKPPA